MKKILLSLAFLAGVSLTVSAQFKIGGKTINTKKVINAATDVAHAATLSDEDVAKMAKEYIQWMDTHNEVAGPDTEMGQRLERLTANVKKVSGLDLNFKVYNVVDVNALARNLYKTGNRIRPPHTLVSGNIERQPMPVPCLPVESRSVWIRFHLQLRRRF